MIETVRFQNYKGFEDVEVKLERLTVFVGPNASGKTSMPRGIESISQTKEVSPDTYFSTEFDNYPYYSYRRGAKSDMVLSWTEPDMEVRVTVVPPDDYESADVLRWDVYMEDWKVKVKSRNLPDGEWIEVFASSDKQNNGSSTPPLSLMLRLEGARLAAPSVVQDQSIRMKSDGTGLASVLANLALTDPDLFLEIQRQVARVVPTVERIRFTRSIVVVREAEPIRVDKEVLTRNVRRKALQEELLFDMKVAPSLPAEAVSEGMV